MSMLHVTDWGLASEAQLRWQMFLQEMDELCAEWQPEPLCGPLTDAQRNYEPPVISR